MSIIPQDIELSIEIAEEVIQRQFPSLEFLHLQKIGEGFDNIVVKMGDLVFRFPRRKFAIPLLEREIKILSFLQNKLSLQIPYPQYIGKPSEIYPYPFYGHRW